MARPLWKGSISFGLVTIPVEVYSATRSKDLRFHQLDRRDNSPIREKRINERTGLEVPWADVAKGYEYEEGSYVVLEPGDFERANVEATETIDIRQVVAREAVPPQYFATPLFVVPTKAGAKPYHILRETLLRAGRLAIATIVMRGRQHLAALLADERILTLELLRFAHELKAVADLELKQPMEAPRISRQELALAEQLVSALDAPWQPESYRDEYRDDLLALIEKKARHHGGAPQGKARTQRQRGAEIVDMMELLKRSVGQARRGKTKRQRAAS